MHRMLEIGKVENGYVIEVHVPIKPEKKKEAKNMISEYPGCSEKKFVAKDMTELNVLLMQLLPMMEEEFTSEDEFNSAFKEASK